MEVKRHDPADVFTPVPAYDVGIPGVWSMPGKPVAGRPPHEYPRNGQDLTNREFTNLVYHQAVCVCGWRGSWAFRSHSARGALSRHLSTVAKGYATGRAQRVAGA